MLRGIPNRPLDSLLLHACRIPSSSCLFSSESIADKSYRVHPSKLNSVVKFTTADTRRKKTLSHAQFSRADGTRKVGISTLPKAIERGTSTKKVAATHRLEPHILSQRVVALCKEKNGHEKAIKYLANTPRDAQNAVVWNVMIHECMKMHAYTTAYKVYIDMKRRGFRPNKRTFYTLLYGLSTIRDWASHPKQLAHAHTLYQEYRSYMKTQDPESLGLKNDPIIPYLLLLGRAGVKETIFDVYYSLDSKGPMAPNQYTYSAAFSGLNAQNTSDPAHNDPDVKAQNASWAKLLWNLMIKKNIVIDDHVVGSAISALSHGRIEEQNLALDIAQEYCGLSFRAENNSCQTSSVALSTPTLHAVLAVCKAKQRHDLIIALIPQILVRPINKGGRNIIDSGIIHYMLNAYYEIATPLSFNAEKALNLLQGLDSSLHTKSMYDRILNICWRSHDWFTARNTFQAMSGYHLYDFSDGVAAEFPRHERRKDVFIPSAASLTYMLRIALILENPSYVREALRLSDYMSKKYALLTPSPSWAKTRKDFKHVNFFIAKFAQAIVDACDAVAVPEHAEPDELEDWSKFRLTAEGFINIDGDDTTNLYSVLKAQLKTGESKVNSSTQYELSLSQ